MTQETLKLVNALQRKLVSCLRLDIEPTDLDPDTELVDLQSVQSKETVQIDSVDLVEFIVAIENALGTEFLEEEDGLMGKRTLRGFADYLTQRVASQRLEEFCAT